MNWLLLAGLLSLNGYGTIHSHMPIVAGEAQYESFRIYGDWATTSKLDSGDGYSFVVRPSYRIDRGEGFYFQPGFEISHQHTSAYSKSAYFAVARAGYNSNHGWDAYAVGYIPLNSNARYAVGAGFDMDTYRGLVGRVEVTIGPRVTDSTNTTRQIRSVVLLGWRWR